MMVNYVLDVVPAIFSNIRSSAITYFGILHLEFSFK